MATNEEQDGKLLNRLDWKSQEILKALYKLGGQATTTEIRKESPIDENDHVTHRYRRASVALEPHGLIKVHHAQVQADQRHLPLKVELTDEGESLAERLLDRSDESQNFSLEERLEKVEGTLNLLENVINGEILDEEYSKETEKPTLEERLTAVEQRLDSLEDALHSEFGAWSTEKQQEHEVVVDGTRAVRDFLIEEHGERFEEFIKSELSE